MRISFGSFVLALVVCLAPVQAQNRDYRGSVQPQRYCDRQGKDWHNWDDKEAGNYQRYQQEKHLPNRELSRLNKTSKANIFVGVISNLRSVISDGA